MCQLGSQWSSAWEQKPADAAPAPAMGEERVASVDRKAAAALIRKQFPGDIRLVAAIEMGDDDEHPAVQAFAEHRIRAIQAAVAEAVEGIAGPAQFLLDRLDDLDFSLSMEDFAREHSGHVDPAIARLRSALEAIRKGWRRGYGRAGSLPTVRRDPRLEGCGSCRRVRACRD